MGDEAKPKRENYNPVAGGFPGGLLRRWDNEAIAEAMDLFARTRSTHIAMRGVAAQSPHKSTFPYQRPLSVAYERALWQCAAKGIDSKPYLGGKAVVSKKAAAPRKPSAHDKGEVQWKKDNKAPLTKRICAECGEPFMIPKSRGRYPKRCASCVAEKEISVAVPEAIDATELAPLIPRLETIKPDEVKRAAAALRTWVDEWDGSYFNAEDVARLMLAAARSET